MTLISPAGKAGASALIAGLGLLALAPAGRAAFTTSVFASGAPVGGTSPDSITVAGSSVFVEYGNGVSSSNPLGTVDTNPKDAGFGKVPQSTIVQYSFTGAVLHTYTFNGSDDGLRYNPTDGSVWVLQNQDGNSGLTVLNPTTGTSTAYTYDAASAFTGRGYDDAQFLGGKTYLSVSNPAAPSDAVIVTATLGAGNVISTAPVLTDGVAGIGDPDSLDLTPSGALLLTGGDDGALVTVTNPGAANQTVSTLQLKDAQGNLSALDDANLAPAGAQTLLVAGYNGASKTNNVYAVTGSFTPGALYASIGSTGSLDLVDPVTGLSAPIAAIPSPHGQAFLPAGVSFVAVPEPSPLALLGLPLAGLLLAARRRRAG